MNEHKDVWMRFGAVLLLAALAYGMVLAYGRYGRSIAMGEGTGDDAPAAPIGPPGAPTRAQVKQLHEKLARTLGTNARGLPRVTHVDYEPWPDRLLVVFALDRNLLTITPAEAAELRPLADVLRATHAGGLRWKYVLLSGTAPVEGPGGRVSETTVVRAVFAREKLDASDWSRTSTRELESLAEQFTVDADLAALRPGGVPSSEPTSPTTLPATTQATPG